jgi:hypothetical protein
MRDGGEKLSRILSIPFIIGMIWCRGPNGKRSNGLFESMGPLVTQ